MTDNHATSADSTITIFRDLIASLPFAQLDDIQLCDLGAIAAESVEGLCHGLHYLGDTLQNDVELPQESLSQLGACLNATAHLIPALLEICEQAERHVRTVTTVSSAPLSTQ
ncbi:hypothetical protein [Pectobacterium aroidearum]|uniref:hypothetical protein n=1 Tax=Pectobacterium aroidearum TaxID=1201031 RepID=UPI002113F5BA|nr:hypothetical protein [Pectobacterium aroidearum]UUE44632.1 hypothetical protein L0Y28_19290 [Pectobacterium aroidearum]UUE48851.1 hypothetical protein L0Y23_19170 [Pectobacterium aroidearum]UUE53055.1 hypothetical protein L0Y30_19290 [Pectobacterium aroidearum]UUE61466.1 hypothetical protein L0Y29_19290 [Pectobacterium aroidearum]UUE65692.1 hypothetical protein L0Y22_19290 [Pectobacterium aroidearum]